MAAIQTLGIASCLGGPFRYCGYAADMLRKEFDRQTDIRGLILQWHMLYPVHEGRKEARIAGLNRAISRFTGTWSEQNQPFLVIGGDHSCAMGTWGGVINRLKRSEQFGLIWFDAHMDAHTFITSPSGNVHGMPLAALLGRADERLAPMYPGYAFIKPQNLVLIGVRSYEKEERTLMERAKVPIIFADQVVDLQQTLLGAVDTLSQSCQRIGISIDLDCLDPEDAPGVETPAEKGLNAREMVKALSSINGNSKLCGLEISEFNPEKDVNHKTLHLMKALVEAFFCEPPIIPSDVLNKLSAFV